MSKHTFAQAVQVNRLHLCSAPQCSLPRSGIDLYCRSHNQRARRYGNPLGKPLSAKLWIAQRKQVADLFEKNAAHKGQLQALDWVGGLLARASVNEAAFKGAEELARLSRHGVAALAILTELCAVTVYLHEAPRTVRDDRQWDFAVSAAIFALAPRPRRMTRKPGTPWGVTVQPRRSSSYAPKARTSALAFIGSHMRQALAPFLANVQNAIATREQQQRAFEAELSAPLTAI